MPERRRLKIMHVVYSLEMGGAEVLVTQLCRIQRAEGHDVSVCAYSQAGVLGEKLRDEGFMVRVLGVAPVWKTLHRYYKLFRQETPDVVHCHNVAPTIQAAPAARAASVRHILTTRHGLLNAWNDSQEMKYALAGHFCDWMVGICETTCSALRSSPLAPSAKVIRIYNGSEPVERVGFQQLGKSGFTMACIGRMAPGKDLGTAIRAAKIAAAQVPGLQFWIVGDGAVRAKMEALTAELGITDVVKFWGQQVNVAPLYCAADLFVMSSLSEGLPMSLLQSMSVAVPAVLSDTGGCGEVLRLSGGGRLFPIGNAEMMADAIVQIATNASLHEDLARKAQAAYDRYFTLEQMNDGYMQLYV